jgi:hypothetical protein
MTPSPLPIGRRTLWTAAAISALLLAACSAAQTVSPVTATPPAADEPAGSGPTALDGTIAYTLDSSSGAGGSTTTSHEQLNVIVHLTLNKNLSFDDSGSTYTYSDTSSSDDPQTVSSCGLHTESAGSGGGSFAAPGSISAVYSDTTPPFLAVHAPYSDTGTQKFLCNGLVSSATTQELAAPECNNNGTAGFNGAVAGNPSRATAGQTIDFSCTETMVIGSGLIKVSGTLTSR